MSSLLTGQKKKNSGMTSYQRPGPPTPSRHNRLSLGGNNSDYKENYDLNNIVSSSKKTPARFKIFSSRFSMCGPGPKDEVSVFGSLFSSFNENCDNLNCVNTSLNDNNDLNSID